KEPPVNALLASGAKRRAVSIASAFAAAALVLTGCAGDAEPAEPSDSLLSQEECERNRDAGTITYISGYGYSASAGLMDGFLAPSRTDGRHPRRVEGRPRRTRPRCRDQRLRRQRPAALLLGPGAVHGARFGIRCDARRRQQ